MKKVKKVTQKIEDGSVEKALPTFEHLHEKPLNMMSRRDLLSAGLIQFSAALTLPSIYSLFAGAGLAQAQEIVCAGAAGSSLVPIITVNLAGGAGLAANFVPHDQALQPLQSYNRLGLGAAGSFTMDYEFKNRAPFAANISRFIVGVRAQALPATLANTVFLGVPNRTADDSAANKMVMDGMVAKAGRVGQILPTLGRNRNQAAFVNPPNPIPVRSFANISDAISVKNSLANLSKAQQERLFRMTQDLSASQTARLQGLSGGNELRTLIQCANRDNTRLIASTDPGVDPALNANFAAVWGINANNRNGDNYARAAVVYNVLNGNAPTGNIEMGGYDYHDGSRTSGDQRDENAGVLVGQILQSFAVMGVKAFLVVTTDGSVTGPISETPGGIWTSDRGTAGMAYMMAYDPSGSVNASSFQLGHFLPGRDQQGVDQSFITGGTPELAAAGMFANYLSFSGQLGLIDRVIPRVISAGDLDRVVKIA